MKDVGLVDVQDKMVNLNISPVVEDVNKDMEINGDNAMNVDRTVSLVKWKLMETDKFQQVAEYVMMDLLLIEDNVTNVDKIVIDVQLEEIEIAVK